MRIVFLSHLDMNLYLFRLPVMQALLEHGHEVIALVPRGEYFDKFNDFKIKAVSYKIDRGSLNPLKELKTIGEISSKLLELKPDILHTFTIKPNIYGSLAARKNHLKCVINSVTGLGSFYIDTTLKAKLLKVIIENLLKIAFSISQKVIFQNQDDLELYVKEGLLPNSKAVLIKGSGVDVDYFSPSQVKNQTILEYKKNLGINENGIVVLMVARIIAHKGVREFCAVANEIYAKYPNVYFLLVGEIDRGNIVPLDLNFLKAQTGILWLGKRTDIRELVGMSDIFVLPSYREGIPRTLLEAGAMGKPIVTTNAVGCKEVVSEGVNGFLVPVGDTEMLKERILQLIANKDLREKLGAASRKKIIQEFSKETIVKEYLEVYKQVSSENFS